MEGKNKGLEIRDAKHRKQAEKRHTIKPKQKGIIRFVKIKHQTFHRISGKTKPAGKEEARGLQVSNKVYLLNGQYKFINNKNLIITEIYDGIPEWATEELTEKYKTFNIT